MNKEGIKESIKNFGNNFFFNVSAIVIFSVFLSLNIESFILAGGVIANILISKAFSSSSNNAFIQKYFCNPTTESQVNASGSTQLFGFLTGYYTINRYIKLQNMTWISSLLFLIAVSILFGRLYIEDSFSLTQFVSFWFLGFFLGCLVGFIGGKMSKREKEKEINSICNNNSQSEDETTCGKDDNEDYVCQAFKDGKVFESL